MEALKHTVEQLRIQLHTADQDKVIHQFEQAHSNHQLELKDEQLAKQAAESFLQAGTSNELAVRLTKQHKELTEAHARNKQKSDILRVSQRQLDALEDKLGAKELDFAYLQGKLN